MPRGTIKDASFAPVFCGYTGAAGRGYKGCQAGMHVRPSQGRWRVAAAQIGRARALCSSRAHVEVLTRHAHRRGHFSLRHRVAELRHSVSTTPMRLPATRPSWPVRRVACHTDERTSRRTSGSPKCQIMAMTAPSSACDGFYMHVRRNATR